MLYMYLGCHYIDARARSESERAGEIYIHIVWVGRKLRRFEGFRY